jgi:hypothetical protein
MARSDVEYPQSEIMMEAILPARPGRSTTYRFADLAVGETFYIYRVDGRTPSGVHASKKYWEGKLQGRKFVVRTVSVGVRVQRVE